ESSPQPEQGEVVVFVDHLRRGFSPPGSKFFRDMLNFFELRPQDLGPNSIINLRQFKCSVKYIFKQSQSSLSSGSSFTS
uniref:Transposase (putative) gypsy type domain-containing protein n=1 Tax=Triticum urartu TaxID=4572 RepID=A0A8R7PQZ6_TRIUA